MNVLNVLKTVTSNLWDNYLPRGWGEKVVFGSGVLVTSQMGPVALACFGAAFAAYKHAVSETKTIQKPIEQLPKQPEKVVEPPQVALETTKSVEKPKVAAAPMKTEDLKFRVETKSVPLKLLTPTPKLPPFSAPPAHQQVSLVFPPKVPPLVPAVAARRPVALPPEPDFAIISAPPRTLPSRLENNGNNCYFNAFNQGYLLRNPLVAERLLELANSSPDKEKQKIARTFIDYINFCRLCQMEDQPVVASSVKEMREELNKIPGLGHIDHRQQDFAEVYGGVAQFLFEDDPPISLTIKRTMATNRPEFKTRRRKDCAHSLILTLPLTAKNELDPSRAEFSQIVKRSFVNNGGPTNVKVEIVVDGVTKSAVLDCEKEEVTLSNRPKYLTVQLKRISSVPIYDQLDEYGRPRETRVHIPGPISGIEEIWEFPRELVDGGAPLRYKLVASIYHIGSLNSSTLETSGHYMACVADDNGTYYLTDDARVSEISREQYLHYGAWAYCLFYERIDS